MEAENAPSIARGLELLESRSFNAIVLDYRADSSSEEFLARLRQSGKNQTSVLIAVVDADFNARPVFGLGANFVLYRPLSSERTRISLRAARGLIRRERRRAPRQQVGSTANVACPGAPETRALMADLSDGGTLIQTASRLPASCKVYFEFELPGQQKVVSLSGEVAWQDASGRTGIRFVDVPQTSRRTMQAWMQQNHPQPAPGLSNGLSPAKATTASPGPPEEQPEENFEPASEARSAGQDSVVLSASNRRGERRFACKLGAEVYRLGTRVPNRCILSDISENGCYVEMPSPLAGQSGVEIVVRTTDTKFRIQGQVLATHPGFGMGVRFSFRDSAEREEIMRLLAALSASPAMNEQMR